MLPADGVDKIHPQPHRQALHDPEIVGLHQTHDVGALRLDHLGQGIGAAFAAVQYVVTDNSHRHRLAPHQPTILSGPAIVQWHRGFYWHRA